MKKRLEQENKIKTDIIRQHHNIQKIKRDELKRKIEIPKIIMIAGLKMKSIID